MRPPPSASCSARLAAVTFVLVTALVVGSRPSGASPQTSVPMRLERQPDVGTPWSRLRTGPAARPTLFSLVAPAGGGMVAQGTDGLYAVDANLGSARRIRAGGLAGLLASDGSVAVWVDWNDQGRAHVVAVRGGASTSITLPAPSRFVLAATAGGRAWFVTAGSRLGTATVSARGFGRMSWITLPGRVSALAAAADGSARVTTDRGAVLWAGPGATAPVLSTMATVAPVVEPRAQVSGSPSVGRWVSVAIGTDGATYVGTADGISRVADDGAVTPLGPPTPVVALTAGPGLLAYRGIAADGTDDVGFLRLDDFTNRWLPRQRSDEGPLNEWGGRWDYDGLAVTSTGRLCASLPSETSCTPTAPRWIPSVTETVHRTVQHGQRVLVVTVRVARRPLGSTLLAPPATGRVRVVDLRSYFFSELAVKNSQIAATAAAPLVDGQATVVLPDRPDPPVGVAGEPKIREVFTGYAGDASYAPNNSTSWTPR